MSPTIASFVPGYPERYLESRDARRVLERVNDEEERHLGVVQLERKIRKEVLESIERMKDRFLRLQKLAKVSCGVICGGVSLR